MRKKFPTVLKPWVTPVVEELSMGEEGIPRQERPPIDIKAIPLEEAKRRVAEYMLLLPRAKLASNKGMEMLLRDVEFSVIDVEWRLCKMWRKPEGEYREAHYRNFTDTLDEYTEWVELHAQLKWMVNGES